MRVVHIARRFAPMLGGIERYVFDVATGQASAGHDVTVVTLDSDVIGDWPGRLPPHETIDGVEVVRLPGMGNRRFAVCLRPDRLIAQLRHADAIHHHDLRFMTGVVAVTAAVYRRPLFIHTHGLLFHTAWATSLKRLAVRAYYGPLLRATGARIIASSQPDFDLLLQHAPYLAERTVTFENAMLLRPLLALQRRPEPGLIVSMGRLARHKGLEDLLRAVAELDGFPCRLEISGTEDREERRRLESITRGLGIRDRVSFRGPYSQEQHLEQLSRASLSVFPSHHEGFGLALLEAMAAGVPLLARDIPAHRSVLGPDLEDRLITIDRPRDLSQAIERELAMSPADEAALAERLRRRAGDFDIGRLLDQIDGLYGSVGRPAARPGAATES